MNRTAPPVTDALIRELAAAAVGDPRTITRVIAGLPVRRLADTRIRAALAERGITAPNPAPQGAQKG